MSVSPRLESSALDPLVGHLRSPNARELTVPSYAHGEHTTGLGTDADRSRRRRVYSRLAANLAIHFADGEGPVESSEASIVQQIHEQASILYDLRDAYDDEADAARAAAHERANEILADSFGDGHSLTLAELEALGVVMREAGFKVLAPYVPVGEVFPCGW